MSLTYVSGAVTSVLTFTLSHDGCFAATGCPEQPQINDFFRVATRKAQTLPKKIIKMHPQLFE